MDIGGAVGIVPALGVMNMPNVSISLSDDAYEAYQSLPKQTRSRAISRMLEAYHLKRQRVVFAGESFSAQEVLEIAKAQGETILKLQELLKEATE